MPDYIPAVQLPTGLAEALVRMKAQASDPFANAISGIGQSISQGMQNRRINQANAPLTPEQQAAIGITSPAQGPTQPGQAPLTQRGGGPAFAGGMPRDLATQILQRQTQEAIARETTSRMMGVQGLKGDQGHFQVTQDMIDNNPQIKKLGVSVGEYLPNSVIANLTKPPSSTQQNAATPEEEAALRAQAKAHPDWYPSDIFKSRGPQYKFLANQALTSPGVDPRKANIAYAAGKTGASAAARFDESGPGQMVARVANSAMEQLDALQKASDNFPRSNVKMMNVPIMKIDEQTMPEAQAWKIALNTARMEYAAALNRGNSPGLENIAEATKALPDSITMKQLPAAIKQLRLGLTNTVKGMTTRAKPNDDNKPAAKKDEKDPLGIL